VTRDLRFLVVIVVVTLQLHVAALVALLRGVGPGLHRAVAVHQDRLRGEEHNKSYGGPTPGVLQGPQEYIWVDTPTCE